MVHVGAVGKVSMVVASVDQPPDIMSPATGKLYERDIVNCRILYGK